MSLSLALLYGWPWWLQALALTVLAGPVLILAARLLGGRATFTLALTLAGAIAAIGGLMRARQRGWADHEEKEARDAQIHVERARTARADAQRVDARRLRDDDGFRRP